MEKERINLNSTHECLYYLDKNAICQKCGRNMIEWKNEMLDYIDDLEQELINSQYDIDQAYNMGHFNGHFWGKHH